MTRRLLRLGLTAAMAAAAAFASARAQTPANPTINPGALDQLAPAPSQSNPPAKPPPGKPPARASSHGRPAAHPVPSARTAAAAKPAVPPAKPLVVPPAPPPPPVLPPPIVVPTRPPPPLAPVPIAANAPGEAVARPDGVRVTFGAGRADISPATDAALRNLVHTGPPFARLSFAVTAYAAGNADDPSTPRRLALSRGLGVRSVLLTEGVPSTRIFVKALGASTPPPDGPPDQVDVAVTGAAPQSQQPGASAGASAP